VSVVHPHVDLPEVVAELAGAFAAYEAALLDNDLGALNDFFLPSPSTVRLGIAEHAFGIESIVMQRAGLPGISPHRRLHNTVITAIGRDAGVVSTQLASAENDLIGRRSQTGVRTVSGWKIVAAHVSVIAPTLVRSFDAAAPVQRVRR
jgi:hypothetical protein